MPSLDEFDPRPVAAAWLKNKERRNKETPKAKEQRWFKSIFKEASQSENDNEDNDDKQSTKLSKRKF